MDKKVVVERTDGAEMEPSITEHITAVGRSFRRGSTIVTYSATNSVMANSNLILCDSGNTATPPRIVKTNLRLPTSTSKTRIRADYPLRPLLPRENYKICIPNVQAVGPSNTFSANASTSKARSPPRPELVPATLDCKQCVNVPKIKLSKGHIFKKHSSMTNVEGFTTKIVRVNSEPSVRKLTKKGSKLSLDKGSEKLSPTSSVKNFLENDAMEKGLEVLHGLDDDSLIVLVTKVMDVLNKAHGDYLAAELSTHLGAEKYREIADQGITTFSEFLARRHAMVPSRSVPRPSDQAEATIPNTKLKRFIKLGVKSFLMGQIITPQTEVNQPSNDSDSLEEADKLISEKLDRLKQRDMPDVDFSFPSRPEKELPDKIFQLQEEILDYESPTVLLQVDGQPGGRSAAEQTDDDSSESSKVSRGEDPIKKVTTSSPESSICSSSSVSDSSPKSVEEFVRCLSTMVTSAEKIKPDPEAFQGNCFLESTIKSGYQQNQGDKFVGCRPTIVTSEEKSKPDPHASEENYFLDSTIKSEYQQTKREPTVVTSEENDPDVSQGNCFLESTIKSGYRQNQGDKFVGCQSTIVTSENKSKPDPDASEENYFLDSTIKSKYQQTKREPTVVTSEENDPAVSQGNCFLEATIKSGYQQNHGDKFVRCQPTIVTSEEKSKPDPDASQENYFQDSTIKSEYQQADRENNAVITSLNNLECEIIEVIDEDSSFAIPVSKTTTPEPLSNDAEMSIPLESKFQATIIGTHLDESVQGLISTQCVLESDDNTNRSVGESQSVIVFENKNQETDKSIIVEDTIITVDVATEKCQVVFEENTGSESIKPSLVNDNLQQIDNETIVAENADEESTPEELTKEDATDTITPSNNKPDTPANNDPNTKNASVASYTLEQSMHDLAQLLVSFRESGCAAIDLASSNEAFERFAQKAALEVSVSSTKDNGSSLNDVQIKKASEAEFDQSVHDLVAVLVDTEGKGNKICGRETVEDATNDTEPTSVLDCNKTSERETVEDAINDTEPMSILDDPLSSPSQVDSAKPNFPKIIASGAEHHHEQISQVIEDSSNSQTANLEDSSSNNATVEDNAVNPLEETKKPDNDKEIIITSPSSLLSVPNEDDDCVFVSETQALVDTPLLAKKFKKNHWQNYKVATQLSRKRMRNRIVTLSRLIRSRIEFVKKNVTEFNRHVNLVNLDRFDNAAFHENHETLIKIFRVMSTACWAFMHKDVSNLKNFFRKMRVARVGRALPLPRKNNATTVVERNEAGEANKDERAVCKARVETVDVGTMVDDKSVSSGGYEERLVMKPMKTYSRVKENPFISKSDSALAAAVKTTTSFNFPNKSEIFGDVADIDLKSSQGDQIIQRFVYKNFKATEKPCILPIINCPDVKTQKLDICYLTDTRPAQIQVCSRLDRQKNVEKSGRKRKRRSSRNADAEPPRPEMVIVNQRITRQRMTVTYESFDTDPLKPAAVVVGQTLSNSVKKPNTRSRQKKGTTNGSTEDSTSSTNTCRLRKRKECTPAVPPPKEKVKKPVLKRSYYMRTRLRGNND